MSVIKIRLNDVESSTSALARQISEFSDVQAQVANLKYNIDSKILGRNNLHGRMNSVLSELGQVNGELTQLKNFLTNSKEKYSSTEDELNRKSDLKFSLNPKSATSSQSKDEKESEDKTIVGLLGDLGKYAVTAQAIVGAGLVLGKQVKFETKNGNKKRTVIHTAKWMKGKGTNPFFKKLARRVDESIRKPGMFMKGMKAIDAVADKVGKFQLTGLSKAKSFPHWMKNVVTGVKDGTSGIATSKIPRMIAKRVYPLDATLNVIEEGIAISGEIKKGTLDGKDLGVSASNVVIKTGATTVGAIVGGTAGLVFGPGGAVVGSFIGGTVGAWTGDAIASFSEKVIRDGFTSAVKDTGNSIKKGVEKGFKWAKGLFK